MFWIAARQIFEECKRLRICRSQRDFSRRLMGRGSHYLRLVVNRRGFTSEKTNRTLRRRIGEARSNASPEAAPEFSRLLHQIDRAEEMALWLRRRA
jgi:hypothetical protein